LIEILTETDGLSKLRFAGKSFERKRKWKKRLETGDKKEN